MSIARRLSLVALVGALALPASAAAAPPQIVRPPNEAGMPPPQLGRQLFAGNCSRCHGSRGAGVRPGSSDDFGPSLLLVGKLATDFYLRTGYMPLDEVPAQPSRNGPQFSDPEIRAIEDYVDSLSPQPGPPIPRPNPGAGNISQGLQLFTEHCAGCHQMVGEGGVVTGARVPPLSKATAVQVAQAVRIGPYVMPRFNQKDISDDQLNSIVRYVLLTQDPQDAGGWGISHLGPFPEGMVIWGIGGVLMLILCVIIGERVRRA